MQNDGFAEKADDAYRFSGALIGSLNVSVGILQMLIWKGLLSVDEALFVITTAKDSAEQMHLPSPYDVGLGSAYDAACKSLRQNT